MIEIGLAENIQRHDFNPLEEARAFQTFTRERNYSIRRLAERIGKDKSYIEDRLALLRAPEDVQQLVAERPDTLRAAREIAGVAQGTLTTSDVRQAVRDNAQRSVATGSQLTTSERQVERDAQAMRAILERWADLVARDTAAGELVAAHTEILLTKFQTIVRALEA